MLVGSKYYLQEKLTDLMNRNSISIQSNDNINKRIIAVNRKINEVYAIQKESVKWSYLLQKIDKLTSTNASTSEISISRQGAYIDIAGRAKKRTNLLELKQNLDQSDLFSKVSLPINDLIERENNSFNIRADLNLDKIPQ